MRDLKKNQQLLYYSVYSDEIKVYQRDEDGNIVRYESNVETNYGNGLISHQHYVAEYKYSDLDVEVFTPQESDQVIEQAKALQEEIDQ